MSMKYRIIFTDLDGTLISNQDKNISAKTIDVLKRALASGIHVVPTTGRPLSLMPEIFFDISDYMILANGSIIYDVKRSEIIIHNPIRYDLALKILNYLEKRDLSFHISISPYRYTNTRSYDYFKNVLGYHYLINDMIPEENLFERIRKEKRGVDKISFYIDPKDRQKHYDELEVLFPEVKSSGSSDEDIELNYIKAGKGNGVKLLCEKLDISLDDAIGFGDSDNDLEMLMTVKTSVVPDNGNEKAKKQATFICASCEDDGPASFIESFL